MRAFLGDGHEERALVLTGAPGIGKTTLWEAGAALGVAMGGQVLRARPSATEAGLPFTALIDVCEPLGDRELGELPVPQRRALEVALPRAGPARAQRGLPLDDAVARYAAAAPPGAAIMDAPGTVQGLRHLWRGEIAAARAIFDRDTALADGEPARAGAAELGYTRPRLKAARARGVGALAGRDPATAAAHLGAVWAYTEEQGDDEVRDAATRG